MEAISVLPDIKEHTATRGFRPPNRKKGIQSVDPVGAELREFIVRMEEIQEWKSNSVFPKTCATS
jgi:hypothetical protein